MIEAKGLTKRYGSVTALQDVDLSIGGGECFGLFGPNGAGKTTTLRLMVGLTKPTAGSVTTAGLDRGRNRPPSGSRLAS